MVITVGHINLPSAVTGYAKWFPKMTPALAFLTKITREGEVRVQYLNMAITFVYYVHSIPAW